MSHESEGQCSAAPLGLLNLAAVDGERQNLRLDTPDVVGFLQQLAALSAALVPRTSCGVTMRRDHQAATVASSDEFAMLLGEIHDSRGQGPCLQALRTGERVKVVDLATDDRWSEYRLHALAAGVRSSISLPLTVNDATIGAVSLYSRARNRFGNKDIRRAEALTLQAATALTLLLRYARQADSGAAPPGYDVEELHQELDEAQETLRTIRAGGFDALVIDTGTIDTGTIDTGTIDTGTIDTDRPSRLLVEGRDDTEEVAHARGVVSEKGRDDPAHRWYRLVSLESFTAACSCGWVSPERRTSDEMIRDVDRHLDEVRQAETARA